MPHKYLCLSAYSDAELYHPDAFMIDIEALTGLKDLLENAARLRDSQPGFLHIEVGFDAGTWVKLDTWDTFEDENPLETGAASNYNDDPDVAPLGGFAARADNQGHIEFRCYEADPGLHSWSDPVRLDENLIIAGNLVYNRQTGELTEAADE